MSITYQHYSLARDQRLSLSGHSRILSFHTMDHTQQNGTKLIQTLGWLSGSEKVIVVATMAYRQIGVTCSQGSLIWTPCQICLSLPMTSWVFHDSKFQKLLLMIKVNFRTRLTLKRQFTFMVNICKLRWENCQISRVGAAIEWENESSGSQFYSPTFLSQSPALLQVSGAGYLHGGNVCVISMVNISSTDLHIGLCTGIQQDWDTFATP